MKHEFFVILEVDKMNIAITIIHVHVSLYFRQVDCGNIEIRFTWISKGQSIIDSHFMLYIL